MALETASLLIANVRAVPWKEHAHEAVANLSIIQNAEQFSFRRTRATHDPYHVASRLDVAIFQIINKSQRKACLFNPLNEAESTWVRSYPVLANTWTRSAQSCSAKQREVNYAEEETNTYGSVLSHCGNADGSGG